MAHTAGMALPAQQSPPVLVPARRPRRRHTVLYTLVVAGVLFVGGWVVSAVTGGKAEPAAAPPAVVASPAPSVECIGVDPALVGLIDDQAVKGAGLVMTGRAAAVRDPDRVQVFMVAAEFTVPGNGRQVGVWATSSTDGRPSAILAVDGMAKQFTSWPDASKTDAGITGGERSVLDARSCLR